MLHSKYLILSQLTKAVYDALAWIEPTSLGQQVSFEQKMAATGSYTIVLHPLKDNGASPFANDIPFSFAMRVSEPMNLTLPALGVAVVAIAVIVFGFISKPKQQPPQVSPPPPPPL
jgi:hypothetical protein